MAGRQNKIVVEKRGTFHDDKFFKDCWDEWDKAMKDAVDRWDKQSSTTTTTTTTKSFPPAETKNMYSQIRSSNATFDDSQAVSCTEENNKYKMVMDVKNFAPENITVKAVDDTVVVEGKVVKKEGNSTSTQTFVRRFMLPPGIKMSAISSALSRDGVLTINAPKLVPSSRETDRNVTVLHGDNTITSKIMNSNFGRPQFIQVTGGPPAGKPSHRDNAPFNPTGGSNVTVYETPRGTTRVTETIMMEVPDRREHVIRTKTDGSDHWRTFNTMVERSQKEMEDMMKTHTISSIDTSKPLGSTDIVTAPVGVKTSRDVIRSGNTVTERQEKHWDDAPAPGVTRTNRALSEASEIKASDGTVVGNKSKQELESKAEGSREEILPDGTKCKIFTKTYETKNSYSASSNRAKAL